MTEQLKKWLSVLDRVEEKLTQVPDFRQYGKLTRATGLVMEAVGLKLPIGALCIVERQTEQRRQEEERRKRGDRKRVGRVQNHEENGDRGRQVGREEDVE